MRIHTSTLTYSNILDAAREARVWIEQQTQHGSKSHPRAFEIHLTGESRRKPNRRGAGDPDAYAATWDQWGVFLAALFAVDPDMVCGTVKHPIYASGEDFADRTGDRFGAPETVMTDDGYRDVFTSFGWPDDAHGDHTFRYQGKPGEQRCTKCSAVQRWVV